MGDGCGDGAHRRLRGGKQLDLLRSSWRGLCEPPPFRSFGRLLIINAGGGYYLLLAGMDQIRVEVGQFVLAGEPVATMGDTSSLSAGNGGVETGGPVLYVEFRKDGGSIDPSPWWAKSQGEKVRG